MNRLLALLLAALLPGSALAADAPAKEKKWKDQTELSLVTANGNSRITTVSAKNVFAWDFRPSYRLDSEAGAVNSKSQGAVTTEQFYALEKVTRKLSERNYLFQEYRWDRDPLASLAHRHALNAGCGRELWKTEKDLLIAEAAPGYVYEERIGADRNDYASGRLYSKFSRQLNPSASFSQDVEHVQSLVLLKDNRLKTETAVTAALSDRFSIKASFLWKHNSYPPGAVLKDDTTTAIALITSF
ncbi:MAG TPA: hypothetical protein DCM05_16830 [Elusimicrobia bacterium]|nr:hypothetical protein [Elusimicrobiota bacterium]